MCTIYTENRMHYRHLTQASSRTKGHNDVQVTEVTLTYPAFIFAPRKVPTKACAGTGTYVPGTWTFM